MDRSASGRQKGALLITLIALRAKLINLIGRCIPLRTELLARGNATIYGLLSYGIRMRVSAVNDREVFHRGPGTIMRNTIPFPGEETRVERLDEGGWSGT